MSVKKILFTVLAGLMMAGVVTAQTTNLKIATMAPDGSFWMKELQRAADEIERRTAGRVAIRFYPGGTMGSDTAVLRKMRIGQLQGGIFLAGGLSAVDPDFEIYNLPLLFRSYDEVDAVRRQMDGRLMEGLREYGYVAFGLTETGFTYLMSAAPTRTFGDLAGRKAWIPQDDAISLAIVDAAGLSPVPLPISDVLTGLQTGLIDTVAAPPVGAIALQWFTKAPFVTDLPITYVCGAIAVTEKAFNSLGPADAAIVREVLVQTNQTLDARSRADNDEARRALIQQGVEFVTPTDEARRQWDSIAAEATRELVAKQGYDRSIIADIDRLLAEIRAGESLQPGVD